MKTATLRQHLTTSMLDELIAHKGPYPDPSVSGWQIGRYHPVARHIATEAMVGLLFLRRSDHRRFTATSLIVGGPTGRRRVALESSENWPLPPTAGRPSREPALTTVGRTSSLQIDNGGRTLTIAGGIVSQIAKRIQVASMLGIQVLEVHPATGAFVAVAQHPHPDERAYRLLAIGLDDGIMDEMSFRDEVRR